MQSADRPTPKQQRELRRLAEKTGTSFAPPKTKADASREITRLRERRNSPGFERREDRQAVDRAMERRGGDSAVRDHEIDGYGSSATWK